MYGPRILQPEAKGPIVLICDHASNHVPAELQNLGLPASELECHIAWDIGAAGVTEALSEIFDAPAILCAISRLVIDCNRQLDHPGLIPERSDETVIPGNLNLTREAKEFRIERWFRPYHDAIEAVLTERESRTAATILVSIHSMTDCLRGIPRPWQIALSSHVDRRLTDPVLASLRRIPGVVVGDNQPYDLDPNCDYSTPFHALRRGLLHLQVEFRQDEVAVPAAQRQWAERFADALAPHLTP
jgi:predicted N-formylglutamate amidohydrolase